MKVLVISDTHGNIANIKHVLGFVKSQKMEAIIHCGDWCDTESVKTVLEFGIPLYTVLGNCDEAHVQEITATFDKSISAIHCALDVWEGELGGRKIAIAHEPWKLDEHGVSGKFDALFYGHLHLFAKVERIGNTLVVNPGALGNTTRPSFAVYDTGANAAELIEIPT